MVETSIPTPLTDDTVVLQFGRVGPNMFNMDYRYPLSPMQGYCARIPNFHSFTVCALLHDSFFGLLKQFRLQTRMRMNISTHKCHAAFYRVQQIIGSPQRFFLLSEYIYHLWSEDYHACVVEYSSCKTNDIECHTIVEQLGMNAMFHYF